MESAIAVLSVASTAMASPVVSAEMTTIWRDPLAYLEDAQLEGTET